MSNQIKIEQINKVIIAGGRDFTCIHTAEDYLVNLVEASKLPDEFTVISGGARGADKVGEHCAKQFNLPLQIYPADWDTYGKRAGYIRNEQMADAADALIAFWDGTSRGTKHMIDTMRKQNKPVFICEY